jgi:hypothetical protein
MSENVRKSGSPEVRKPEELGIAAIIRVALEALKSRDFRTSGLPDSRTFPP